MDRPLTLTNTILAGDEPDHYLIEVRVSPRAEHEVERIASEQKIAKASVMDGFIHAHFVESEDRIRLALSDGEQTHIVATVFEEPLVVAQFIRSVRMSCWMMHRDEHRLLEAALEHEQQHVDLGWARFDFLYT